MASGSGLAGTAARTPRPITGSREPPLMPPPTTQPGARSTPYPPSPTRGTPGSPANSNGSRIPAERRALEGLSGLHRHHAEDESARVLQDRVPLAVLEHCRAEADHPGHLRGHVVGLDVEVHPRRGARARALRLQRDRADAAQRAVLRHPLVLPGRRDALHPGPEGQGPLPVLLGVVDQDEADAGAVHGPNRTDLEEPLDEALLLRVDADPVDDQLLREDQGVRHVAAQHAADGQVEDQVERAVEGPLPLLLDLLAGHPAVLLAVEVPDDRVLVPLHRIGVHVGAEHCVAGGVGLQEERITGVVGTVHGSDHVLGVTADVLHGVDLADRRPLDLVVLAQRPERRPGTDAGGHLGADLEPGVLPAPQPMGGEPGRGDEAVPAVGAVPGLLEGGDHEVALAVGVRVVGAVGVALQLVVGGVGELLELPVPGVGQGAVRPVELVAPDELALGLSGGAGTGAQPGRGQAQGRDRPRCPSSHGGRLGRIRPYAPESSRSSSASVSSATSASSWMSTDEPTSSSEPSRARAARPALLSINSAILVSIVCEAMIRHAVTGSAWPMRCTRSMAWVCSASVQESSARTTLEEIWRLMPTPAAIREQMMIWTSGSSWNALMFSSRAFGVWSPRISE